MEELKELEGANFVKFWKCGSFYKIRLRKKWNVDIVLKPPELMFITRREFKCSADNFSMKIRKELSGSRLINVHQIGFDRIVVLEFSNGKLIIELFSHGNIILTRDNKIITALRSEEWRDRIIKQGYEYRLPEQGINPFDMDVNEFKMLFDGENIVRTLVKKLRLGKRYINTLIAESGEDGNSKMPRNAENMFDIMKDIIHRFNPGIEDKPTLFKTNENFNPTKSFNEALDDFYADNLNEEKPDKKLIIRLENQKRALDEMKTRSEEYKRIGDLIYKNMYYLNDLIKKIWEMRKNGMDWKDIEKELGIEINPKTAKMWVYLD